MPNQILYDKGLANGLYDNKFSLEGEAQYYQDTEKRSFQQGGQKKPIYVNSKNDLRYVAYQDSLLLNNLSEKQRLKGTNNKENILFNNKSSDVLDERERRWYQDTRKQLKGKFFPNSEVSIMIQGNDDRKNPKSKQNDYNNDEYFHPDIKPIKGYNWSTESGLLRMVESNDNFLYKKPQQLVIVQDIRKPNTITSKQIKEDDNEEKVFNDNFQFVKPREKLEVIPRLTPQGVQMEEQEFNTELPQIRQVTQQPKYYDVTDKVNQNFGGSETNYKWYPLDGRPLRELSQEKYEDGTPYNSRVITPRFQQGGTITDNEKEFLKEFARLNSI